MFWIGLYLDGSMVKWAKVTRQKKKICIELLRTSPFSENDCFSFPQSAIEECSYKLISGLDTSEVLLRNIQLKLQDRKKILKLLPFQMEPQIPFPPDEAIASIQVLPGEAPKSSKVSFYATKKSSLQQHIDLLKQKKADPDEVSCTPAALLRFCQHFFPELSDTLVLHIGSKASTLLGLLDKKICFSHSFSLGSEDPLLQETLEPVKKELDRIFTFFLKKQKAFEKHIVLTGNFSNFPLLKKFIVDHLPEGMELHECIGGESYDATTLESYAIPVGLALEGLLQDGYSTSFREKTFEAPSRKKQRIKLFLSLSLASLTLLSTTLLITHMYKDQKRKSLIHSFQSSFPLQSKKIDTLADLEAEVSLMEIFLKKEKIPYPLTLSVPNVSEVLAWLSSHPSLNTSAPNEEKEEIDMRKVKYQLLKYPKNKEAKVPYIAKVEIEIEISSRLVAKNFQESLLKENSFIDSKKEVSWQSKGSTYFISFFLKPHVGGNR